MTKFSLSIKATLTALLGVFLLGWAPARAQVAVDLPDVTHQVGTTPTVPVTVGDLTGQNVTSYQFVLAYDNSVVRVTGASFAGTLSDVQGARVEVNTTVPGQITVSYAASVALSGAGTLLNLHATAVSDGLSALEFSSFFFNEGTPEVAAGAGSFFVPELAIYITDDNSGTEGVPTMVPVFVDDLTSLGVFAYTIDISYDADVIEVTGVSFDGTVSQGGGLSYSLGGAGASGALRLAAARNTAMEGSGVLFYLMVDPVGAGMSALTFDSVVFNEGEPEVGGINGSITIAANAAPVFAGSPGTVTIMETETFAYGFSATDPEGEDVTLTLSVGGGVANVSFEDGAFSFTPDLTQAGSYNFVVAASDGAMSSSVSFTVNVTNKTESYEATLAGVNETPEPVNSPGAGHVSVLLDEGAGTVVVSGSFSALSSPYTMSHIHSGAVGVDGPPVLPLDVTVDGTGRAGTFSGTYNVNPTVISSLQNGGLYVNVHTAGNARGELRGQLLSAPNHAPGATQPRAPSEVTIAGDGGAPLINVSWLAAADPDGDAVNYIFEMALDAAFTQGVALVGYGDGQGFSLTVADAAQLFDALTNGTPGNVNLGGSATVFHRVITTDGSLWTVGPSKSLTLTRGQVTANEDEFGIPTEFALQGNYPNPFNPSTSIRFDLPESASVSVAIVDMLGRQVMSVPAQQVSAGAGRVMQIDASALTSGTYVYRVTARGAQSTHIATGTMTLIK